MVDRLRQKITVPFGNGHHGIDLRTWDKKFWKPQLIVFPETCKVLRIWEDDWGGGMAVKPLDSTQFDELKFIHVKFALSIKEGKVYNKNDPIGYSMLSKLCKSHHLHFEVHVKGKAINPLIYLKHMGIEYD